MISFVTAHISYSAKLQRAGYTVVDITVKSGNPIFAPTWQMVMGIKKGTMTEDEYTEKYLAIMDSHEEEYLDWLEESAGQQIALVCYCPEGAFCHRLLLKEHLLALCEANDVEVESSPLSC